MEVSEETITLKKQNTDSNFSRFINQKEKEKLE